MFEIPGRPWTPANGQYFVDRDGYAILTSYGRPIHTLHDENARIVHDENDHVILIPIEAPDGAHILLEPDST